MKKRFKVRRSREYEECYTKGQRIITNHFVIFAKKRKSDGIGPRLGITVTRKIGKAVLRNRIKRLIREGFKMSILGGDVDVDIVVVAKKGIDGKKLVLKDVASELKYAYLAIKKRQKD